MNLVPFWISNNSIKSKKDLKEVPASNPLEPKIIIVAFDRFIRWFHRKSQDLKFIGVIKATEYEIQLVAFLSSVFNLNSASFI